MWELNWTAEYQGRHKRFERKRPRETEAVLTNLNRYFEALLHGAQPKQIQGGWIHPEPLDVVALDQKGGGKKKGGKNHGKGLAQIRLYVYPDRIMEVLHIILLGDKDTQKEDISYCKAYVQNLSNEKKAARHD